jgi:hypothetical protein
MGGWNRFWLYSQAGMIVVATLCAVVGIVLLQGAGVQMENPVAVATNSYFLLPGIVLSLLANQIVLLARKPRVVSTAERILLGMEYAVILLLVACSTFGILFLMEIVLAICLVPLAVVMLVLIASGNSAHRRLAPADAPVVGYPPPTPGDRIA